MSKLKELNLIMENELKEPPPKNNYISAEDYLAEESNAFEKH